MRPLIPADVARCFGDESGYCAGCARKEQAKLDAADSAPRWYPYMNYTPGGRACVYKLECDKERK